MTDDLAMWLLEQIAEDERLARDVASPSPWVVDDQQREDRAIYGAAPGATVAYDPAGDVDSKFDFAHIVRWDPARVLAECDAKRRIIDLHEEEEENELQHGHWEGHGSNERWIRDEPNDCPVCDEDEPCLTLRLLALPYADRPGYRAEWAPCAST